MGKQCMNFDFFETMYVPCFFFLNKVSYHNATSLQNSAWKNSSSDKADVGYSNFKRPIVSCTKMKQEDVGQIQEEFS
jgi:hypothetical protein